VLSAAQRVSVGGTRRLPVQSSTCNCNLCCGPAAGDQRRHHVDGTAQDIVIMRRRVHRTCRPDHQCRCEQAGLDPRWTADPAWWTGGSTTSISCDSLAISLAAPNRPARTRRPTHGVLYTAICRPIGLHDRHSNVVTMPALSATCNVL